MISRDQHLQITGLAAVDAVALAFSMMLGHRCHHPPRRHCRVRVTRVATCSKGGWISDGNYVELPLISAGTPVEVDSYGRNRAYVKVAVDIDWLCNDQREYSRSMSRCGGSGVRVAKHTMCISGKMARGFDHLRWQRHDQGGPSTRTVSRAAASARVCDQEYVGERRAPAHRCGIALEAALRQ